MRMRMGAAIGQMQRFQPQHLRVRRQAQPGQHGQGRHLAPFGQQAHAMGLAHRLDLMAQDRDVQRGAADRNLGHPRPGAAAAFQKARFGQCGQRPVDRGAGDTEFLRQGLFARDQRAWGPVARTDAAQDLGARPEFKSLGDKISGYAISPSAARAVVEARPDVFNHNVEVVPRLYPLARRGSRCDPH